MLRILRWTTLFIIIIAWCLFYLGHGQLAHAGTIDHLVISEVQAGDNKFIKLHNLTAVDVDISGWSIQYRGLAGSFYSKKNFEQGDVVITQGFFTVQKNECAPDNLSCMRWSSFPLAASGGNVFLVSSHNYIESDEDVSIVDKMIYGDADPIPEQPDPEYPDIQAGEVVINEFVPNPTDGQEEWIELYNKTNQELNLEGCKFIDNTGNSIINNLSGSLPATGFLVFDMTSARLNNSGDIIKLQSANNTIIDTVTYGNWNDGNLNDNAPATTKPGQSIARKSNGGDSGVDKDDFALSDAPTKGVLNIITINTITPVGGVQPLSQSFSVPAPKIVINEFVSDPEDEPEWIELYNAGDVSVDLEGWWIEEGSETKAKLSGTMMPGDFKVVSDIAGGLNNKADIIRLKNNKGEVIDWVSYGAWEDGVLSDNAPFTSDPNSVIRRVDGQDTDNDKNDFVITSARTKGKANVAAENIPSPQISLSPPSLLDSPSHPPLNLRGGEIVDKLFINEIMPNPEGSDSEEWVELFWAGEAPLDLAGFKIDDKDGGSKPFVIGDLKVGPNGYAVLNRELTKIAFNNDTDEARLLDKTGALIDAVEYEEGKEGLAYARGQDDAWEWTKQPTPGGVNVIEIQNSKVKSQNDNSKLKIIQKARQVNISEIRGIEAGTEVVVKGIVSVPPGILGSQIFYITDGLSGLQIYSNKKLFPKIDIGDVVEIVGELSQAQGETRLKTKTARDIQIISKGTAPVARELDEPVFDEENEGGLIKIKGTIINKTNSGFIIDTGAGEISVAIKKSAGINTRDLIPGLQVVIAGIVGNSSSGYRLMPRLQEDIQVVGVDEMIKDGQNSSGASGAEENQNPPYAKATAFAGGGAALAALGIRRRKMFISGFRAALFLVKKGV